ncbi:MaoC family dehydratase [Streptomyces sp. NPDC048595]|uniref:MaoC family dehydratase n=1 Tax=Streptomyces sp. NPDC048595 TaxID=3365576 RepID=UPI00371079E0
MTPLPPRAAAPTPPTSLRCGPYAIDRERIAAFAAALGDPHPAYTDPAAARALGHPDTIAPPTYLATLAARAEDALLSARPQITSLDGAVHRSQSLRHARPAHAGDTLHATVRLTEASALAGCELLTLDCEFHDAAGLWVATTTSALLCRVAPGPPPAQPRPGSRRPRVRRPHDPTGSEHP